MIGYGTSFLYDSGSLCYVHDDDIRVLDVHGAAQREQVMNISNVLARLLPQRAPTSAPIRLSLLHYTEGILAFLVELAEGPEAWLFAIDLRRRPENPRSGRLRLRVQISSTRRLFVRHNRSYLYYGTHSSLGYHGFPLWAISCVDLRTGQHLTEKPVKLENFAGNEIGQTVCFGLHQDHLYAVSTQVDFEEEEVDWTSFYIWICLAPDGNPRRVTPNRTWRRQHREGPINDSWTDLTLRQDEATKQLMILECRREWRDGGSENCRTYYTQALPSPEDIYAGKFSVDGPIATLDAQLPPGEPLAKALNPSSKPSYERPKKRLRRHYHTEYQLADDTSSQRRDFILAKTKYRTYNTSSSSFVDLVNDPRPDTTTTGDDRLRLRTVSRKRKTPIDEAGEEGPPGLLFQPDLRDSNNNPLEHSEERFVSRGVHLWPPDDAPAELHQLLCPSKRAGRVQAMADERSLVYSVNHDGLPDGTQALILINFDPAIRLPGLTRLLHYTCPNTDTACNDDLRSAFQAVAVGIEQPQLGRDPRRERHSMSVVRTRPAGLNSAVPSVREEPALYSRINHGYWLR